MKKLTLSMALILLLMPAIALAQDETVPEYTGDELIDILETFADWLFTILLIVAVIFLVLFALAMTTAAGSPDAVERGRNYIIYALIAVAVAVASRGLVALVRTIMGG